jgi:hypothetical protein
MRSWRMSRGIASPRKEPTSLNYDIGVQRTPRRGRAPIGFEPGPPSLNSRSRCKRPRTGFIFPSKAYGNSPRMAEQADRRPAPHFRSVSARIHGAARRLGSGPINLAFSIRHQLPKAIALGIGHQRQLCAIPVIDSRCNKWADSGRVGVWRGWL